MSTVDPRELVKCQCGDERGETASQHTARTGHLLLDSVLAPDCPCPTLFKKVAYCPDCPYRATVNT